MNGFEKPLWKDKFEIFWCNDCGVAGLKCPDCELTTCIPGGHCDTCLEVFVDFINNVVGAVDPYLTKEEAEVYHKTNRLRDLILETLATGQRQIDWKKLHEAGRLSHNDEKVFTKEIREGISRLRKVN